MTPPRSPQLSETELEIKAEMLTCKHFNGVHREECRAGVNYRALAGEPQLGCMTRLPCIPAMEPKGGPRVECEKRERPTREEAEQTVERGKQRMAQTIAALRIVHDDAKAKSLKRGHGGNGQVACPVCQQQLRYSVADYNGHIHAACETKGCVQWME